MERTRAPVRREWDLRTLAPESQRVVARRSRMAQLLTKLFQGRKVAALTLRPVSTLFAKTKTLPLFTTGARGELVTAWHARRPPP